MIIDIPLAEDKFSIPPFHELTMILFGIPSSGKTRFAAGCPKTLFLATEPGTECIKARALPVRDWQYFQAVVVQIANDKKAGRTDVQTVVIDIVDNLYMFCRDAICAAKGLAYPPATDFGKTWAEITKEWSSWLRALMDMVNVRFISHTATRTQEIANASGLREEIDVFYPTFAGSKAAQYLDGVVNAMGFLFKNSSDKHCITFKQTSRVAAKDRTDVLAKLGDIVLPENPDQGWNHVAALYEAKAKELGFEIRSMRG